MSSAEAQDFAAQRSRMVAEVEAMYAETERETGGDVLLCGWVCEEFAECVPPWLRLGRGRAGRGVFPAHRPSVAELLALRQRDAASYQVRHGDAATTRGGPELPPVIRGLMRASSRFMTSLAYWI